MKKKILFCSIAAPPKIDPESLQVGRYLKGIVDSDFSFELITSKNPTLFMPVDNALKKNLKGVKRIYEVKIRENKWLNYFYRRIGFKNINRPDSKFSFAAQSNKVIKSISDKPDIIYSRADPGSSTIMAKKLVEHFNCPWILHLSDPWSWSPLDKRSLKDQDWHENQEEECFTMAKAICLTSMPTLNRYKDIYPEHASKFHYFPNVFDEENLENDVKTKPQNHNLHIVYTGGLAGKRDPLPLLNVLEQLIEKGIVNEKDISLTFAGPIDRKCQAQIDMYKFNNITHLGQLSYKESIQLQQKADLLLVIDNELENEDESVFFPSKILDYFLMKKKIFAITTLSSCTESVLGKNKHLVTYRDDFESISSAIQQALMHKKNNSEEFFNIENNNEEYSYKFQSERLLKLFEKISSVEND